MKRYAIARINPSRSELWQLHKAGCVDLTRNRWKHNIESVDEVTGETPEAVEDAFIDPDLREMGYEPGDGHFRIMPCCKDAKEAS